MNSLQEAVNSGELGRLSEDLKELLIEYLLSITPFSKSEIEWSLNNRKMFSIMYELNGISRIDIFVRNNTYNNRHNVIIVQHLETYVDPNVQVQCLAYNNTKDTLAYIKYDNIMKRIIGDSVCRED